MRFQPAIEMNIITITAIEKGTLQLQVGQWLRFGSTLSRYVGVTPSGALWIEHSRHPTKTVFEPARFKKLLSSYRSLWAAHLAKEVA